MATVPTKPEKKKRHADVEKETASGAAVATEVQKLDLDCGCFRYRSLNLIRGNKLKKLTLIDSQDSVVLRQQKRKVKDNNVEAEEEGSGTNPLTRSEFMDGRSMEYALSDENPNGCFVM